MLADLLSIPYNMIMCVRNNKLDIYLNYVDFVMNNLTAMNEEFEVIWIVNKAVGKINEIISNILKKSLIFDLKNDFNPIHIAEVLKINSNPIFNNIENDGIKQASLILYQFSIIDKSINFVEFLKLKILTLVALLNSNSNLLTTTIDYILNIYVKGYINAQLISYPQTKAFLFNLTNFMREQNVDLSALNSLNLFEDILLNKFISHIKEQFASSLNLIKKYLSSIKDLRRLLSIENDLVKYDILVIINNNISEIFSSIYELRINKIVYKKVLLNEIDSHIGLVLEMLRAYFEDNYYFLDNSLTSEIDNFKATLCNTLLMLYNEIYRYLDIYRLWQEKEAEYVRIIFNLAKSME
jgi:hypothetical protein